MNNLSQRLRWFGFVFETSMNNLSQRPRLSIMGGKPHRLSHMGSKPAFKTQV